MRCRPVRGPGDRRPRPAAPGPGRRRAPRRGPGGLRADQETPGQPARRRALGRTGRPAPGHPARRVTRRARPRAPRPAEAAPVSNHTSHKNTNLRAELTSFVGRDAELRQVAELLGTYRLITLTGPGGAGKTRLAVEAARAELPAAPDGVWLIELALVTDPADVASAVLSALGLREQAPGPGQLRAPGGRGRRAGRPRAGRLPAGPHQW